MSTARKIHKTWKSRPTLEGAGVHLRRAFGFDEVGQFDPFLLLDDFRSDTPVHYLKGFPWHPHRGIETITYVLRGDVEHGDSMGNRGDIGAGDVQWMTAGSGIIHQEMPKGDPAGSMWGFQLWANLPASSKMMPPRYRGITAAQIPQADLGDGIIARVISGSINGVQGPVRDVLVDPRYLDISMPAGRNLTVDTPAGHTVFAYVFEGQGIFCHERDPFAHDAVGENYFDLERRPAAGDHTLILFEGGDTVTVSATDQPVRFLLVSGRPLGEPIAWYGPIVMNTQAELRTAFEEFQQGTFIK